MYMINNFKFSNWIKAAQSQAVDIVEQAPWTYVVYNNASKALKDKIKGAGFSWKSVSFTFNHIPQTGAWGIKSTAQDAIKLLNNAGVTTNQPEAAESISKVDAPGKNLFLDIPRSRIIVYGSDAGSSKAQLKDMGFVWDSSAAVPVNGGIVMGGWVRVGRISAEEVPFFNSMGFTVSDEMVAKPIDLANDADYSDIVKAKLGAMEGKGLDKAAMQDLVETLIDSVSGEFSEENMAEIKEKAKKFLEFSSKFWNLSWMNQMLLHIQKPHAEFVKREKAWMEMGRRLKQDASPAILFEPFGPRISLTDKEKAKLKGDGYSDADIKKMDGRIIPKGFRAFATFDISDTEPIPGAKTEDVASIANLWRKQNTSGEYENALLNSIVRVAKEDYNFAVDMEDTGSAGGYSTGDRRIVIHKGSTGMRAVGTTLHELVHEVFHDKERRRSARADKREKQILEIEAESGAYLVMRAFGLEGFEDASKAYITLWKGNQEDVRAAMNRMKDIVSEIITRIRDKIGVGEVSAPAPSESSAQTATDQLYS